MSQEKKTKVFLFFLSSTIFLLSCGDWLSVQPSNAVTEEKLFSTREGFFQALNGIYLELNSPANRKRKTAPSQIGRAHV